MKFYEANLYDSIKKIKGLEMFLIIIIKDTGGLYRENGKTLKTLKRPQ